MCATAPGQVSDPGALPASLDWIAFQAPNTVAGALRAAGRWSLHAPTRRFDSEDWWFRTTIRSTSDGDEIAVLGFDGIATLAQVWLDGELKLVTDNMFVGHEIPLDRRGEQELVICCRSLDHALAAKRPRPRWRAPMIENQQLRWFRTTVLGRTPGWSPSAAAVGPWRDVWIEHRSHFSVRKLSMQACLEGGRGTVKIALELDPLGPSPSHDCKILVSRNGRRCIGSLRFDASTAQYVGDIVVEQPDLWWPHTHGDPALYDVALEVSTSAGGMTMDLGHVGFRTIVVDTQAGEFAVSVNGVRIFCRGACWTPLDCVSLHRDAADYEATVNQLAAAGMNMVRIGGTMIYESDALLDACDRHGILVWQEFMFANMDFPFDDPSFARSVDEEVRYQLARLQGRPSLAVLCGNSEVAQQSAMWGAPESLWYPEFFTGRLREHCARACPDVAYWPSSAAGGEFPHQPNVGTSSYYGVGAYLRPPSDARRSEVRFASEALAFANVPQSETIATMPGGHALKVHHPAWKAAAPRDLGAGWDFEDVRDHYLRELFDTDPLQLRYSDHDRYLELSRVVTGEVMAASFAEWRRVASNCRGALIWYLRDFVPGAGWGIIDATGKPKACYYIARRALPSRAVSLSDEGLNGLMVHVHNEHGKPLAAELKISLYNGESTLISAGSATVTLDARSSRSIAALSVLGAFHDVTYAYRFGARQVQMVVAELSDQEGRPISEACYFPDLGRTAMPREVGLAATATKVGDHEHDVIFTAEKFAYCVSVEVEGFDASDQFFHVVPGRNRKITLRQRERNTMRVLRGTAKAVNSAHSIRITSAS